MAFELLSGEISVAQGIIKALVIISPILLCTTATYRLYFSPLAKFPGRKLAALTGWYETYYDCWCQGRYGVEILSMHKEFGKLRGEATVALKAYRNRPYRSDKSLGAPHQRCRLE